MSWNKEHGNGHGCLVTGPLALLATLVLAACGGGMPEREAPSEPPPVAVHTRTAVFGPMASSVLASGGVEPWRRVEPGSKILGRVDSVTVREGDQVEAGRVLARLESGDLEAAVAQARAAVEMAEAQLTNAEAQYRRMTELAQRGSATAKNLEDATAAWSVAEASLAQAQANRVAAEVTLGYAEIRSPIAGYVVAKQIEAGDMATPGRPLFVLEDLSRVQVAVQVAEEDVASLTAGAPAWLELGGLPGEIEARIDRILPAGDPASRTFTVQLVVDNSDGRLRSGMFARARFERGRREALFVPEDGGSASRTARRRVRVVEDGRARLRWVQLGRAAGGGVEVLSGLEAGETFRLAGSGGARRRCARLGPVRPPIQ